jgi:hypothetical protein
MTTTLDMFILPQGAEIDLRESKYTPFTLNIPETMDRAIASLEVTSS